MKRLLKLLFLGCCALVGGSATTFFSWRLQPPALAEGQSGLSTSDIHKLSERFEAVAKKIGPTVVAVEATKSSAASPTSKSKPVEESGSGVLIKVAGQQGILVLTNNHVISQAPANQITVSLADNRIVKPAYVWADPESDVAILRLDGIEDLPTAPLGDSDGVRVGQWVLAVGSPFGLNQTVTHGIISARERGQISLGNTIRIKDFLQTDAAINPGSSGGPLVNLDGEVIGLNTAIASHSGSNSGVAFSIPINMVRRVTRQLLEKGSVTRGYLGLQVAQSFEPADALKLGLEKVQGALVEAVYPGTPGFEAGLKSNDIILQVDGFAIRNENHLINMISGLPAGQKVRLQIWRDRRQFPVDAVIGDWSKAQTRFKPKQ
ncbi:MAG: S1C family serine protease [Gemmataceae bacterium]